MDIADLVTEDYESLPSTTPVSKLIGIFEDPAITGVIVTDADGYDGVVTRRQLLTSHHPPDEHIGSLVWHVPRLDPGEDVRDVARLMIDSGAHLLPVFDGATLTGVVTVDAILDAVKPYLDALDVHDAASTELQTVAPTDTVGTALHIFRDNHITHLPVIEDDAAVGMLSLYDVTTVTVRAAQKPQGGDGPDAGGPVGRGGFGAREGERDRTLDLPVRDLMVSPVQTITPDRPLDEAVDTMLEFGGSSLVVTTDGSPHGIITKTDILDALTWEAGGNRGVQVYNIDLVDDLSYDDIVAMVDEFDEMDRDMRVLDAKIHFHEHDETQRGTPLLLVRVRLHTDRGLFIGTGEGYGAAHALNEARDVLTRQIRDQKTFGRSKKPRDAEFWEKRFGWLLESEP
ncbi:MAG: CBS domain-containing protein [Halobacteriaceae archaeon]